MTAHEIDATRAAKYGTRKAQDLTSKKHTHTLVSTHSLHLWATEHARHRPAPLQKSLMQRSLPRIGAEEAQSQPFRRRRRLLTPPYLPFSGLEGRSVTRRSLSCCCSACRSRISFGVSSYTLA